MSIQCLHCGSERFHVVITDDGRSELRCVNYDGHMAESEA
jgi:L-lactate utilization protein LutB